MLKRLNISVIALCFLSLSHAVAAAALTVTVATVAAESPGTGFLDITLTNNGTPQTIGAFQLDIALNASDVAITDVTIDTLAPYVFGSDSLVAIDPIGFPFFTIPFLANDISLDANGYVTVGSGETVGLARVFFSVDSGAPIGLREVSVLQGPTTEFLDGTFDPDTGNLNQIPASEITFVSGGVFVALQQSELTVPEPSSAALFLGGLSIFCGVRRRRLALHRQL